MKSINFIVITTLMGILLSCGSSSQKEAEEAEEPEIEVVDTIITDDSIFYDFSDIGKVEVVYYHITEDGIRTDFKTDNLLLRVKKINGENFYYIYDGEDNYLVEKTKISLGGDWKNAKADRYYFNNPAWPLVDEKMTPSDSIKKPSSSPQNPPRQLQPMQVWIPCGACNNSGQCQTCLGQGWTLSMSAYDGKSRCISCNGNGKCHFCAGQGGHNEIQYR